MIRVTLAMNSNNSCDNGFDSSVSTSHKSCTALQLKQQDVQFSPILIETCQLRLVPSGSCEGIEQKKERTEQMRKMFDEHADSVEVRAGFLIWVKQNVESADTTWDSLVTISSSLPLLSNKYCICSNACHIHLTCSSACLALVLCRQLTIVSLLGCCWLTIGSLSGFRGSS